MRIPRTLARDGGVATEQLRLETIAIHNVGLPKALQFGHFRRGIEATIRIYVSDFVHLRQLLMRAQREFVFSKLRFKCLSSNRRGAAQEGSPGRKPGVDVGLVLSPGGAKDTGQIFRPFRGSASPDNGTPGLRPGLRS